MLDLETLGAGLGDLVLDAVERSTAPLIARIVELEGRPPSRGQPGEPGPPGKDGRDAPTAEDLTPMVERICADLAERMRGAPGEKGDPGEEGRPGKDAPPPTDEQINAAVIKALEPVEGRINPIAVQVQRYLELFPPPAGPKGDPGGPGEKGEPGEPGRDGVGLAGAVIDREGNLIITLADGTARPLGPVVGKDGRDAQDGQPGEKGDPGFSLEDFDSEIRDGGRTLVLSFTAGDIRHTVEHQLDTMIYRGAYKAGQEYQPGDTTSCGGQLFHCNTTTTDRPDGGSESWTLCSRRGRDGKDADPAPMLRLIEDKFKDAEDSLVRRIEDLLRSKGL